MEFSQEQMNAFLVGTSQRTDLDLWTRSVTEMSGPRQVFVRVWELEQEVCNGGFRQYFHNMSGEGAPLCASALRTIGAEATARLVEQSISAFGSDTVWQDEDARQAQADSLDAAVAEQLDDLDQTFYQYEDNLTALLFGFVIANIGSFPPPQA